jgi:hypothetical protein
LISQGWPCCGPKGRHDSKSQGQERCYANSHAERSQGIDAHGRPLRQLSALSSLTSSRPISLISPPTSLLTSTFLLPAGHELCLPPYLPRNLTSNPLATPRFDILLTQFYLISEFNTQLLQNCLLSLKPILAS